MDPDADATHLRCIRATRRFARAAFELWASYGPEDSRQDPLIPDDRVFAIDVERGAGWCLGRAAEWAKHMIINRHRLARPDMDEARETAGLLRELVGFAQLLPVWGPPEPFWKPDSVMAGLTWAARAVEEECEARAAVHPE